MNPPRGHLLPRRAVRRAACVRPDIVNVTKGDQRPGVLGDWRIITGGIYAWCDAVRGGTLRGVGGAGGYGAERRQRRRDDESRWHQRAEYRGGGDVLHAEDGLPRSVPGQ